MSSLEDFEILRTTLTRYLKEDEIVTVPSNVTRILKSSFMNSDVKSLFLPDNLKYLDNSSFENCINLMTVNIPETLTILPSKCFKRCRELLKVFIPESIKSIEHE